MRKAIHSAVLVLVIFTICLGPVGAQMTGEHEADAIKQDVSRLRTSTENKISVKLRSGSKLKGYLRDVGADSFTIRTRPNTDVEVRYADVLRVSRTGLTKNQKVALFAGALGTAVVLGIVFRPKAKGGLRCLLCN